MRLTAVAVRLPPRWRNRLEALAAVVAALFMVQLILPAIELRRRPVEITTPALGIRDSYRAVAILVGAVLMLVVALMQMVDRANLRELAFCLPVIAISAGRCGSPSPSWRHRELEPACLLRPAGAGPRARRHSHRVCLRHQHDHLPAVMTNMPMSIVVSRMDEGMSSRCCWRFRCSSSSAC